MAVLKSRWKKKGTGDIIHPETEIDQLKNGADALSTVVSTLLKAASNSAARSAIEAAAASHKHASGDITSFATSVITAIGEETLSALGVRYSITTNGYICFGDLFGGLILQWAKQEIPLKSNANEWNTFTALPLQWPTSIIYPTIRYGDWSWGGPSGFMWYNKGNEFKVYNINGTQILGSTKTICFMACGY